MFQLNMYENFGKCIQSRKIEIYGYLQAISMIRFVKSSVAAIKVMFRFVKSSVAAIKVMFC